MRLFENPVVHPVEAAAMFRIRKAPRIIPTNEMTTWLRGCICRSRALFGGSGISSSQFRVSLTVGSFIPSRLASGNSWTDRTHIYHLLSFQTLKFTLARRTKILFMDLNRPGLVYASHAALALIGWPR